LFSDLDNELHCSAALAYTRAQVTTGAPIYLVSACSTGEEFVAAFRRYADRGSLFVPIAEPIPAGRRGRFALTLAGGGVLIEGEAEVISSSKIASVLHGRVGMTIRFGGLDEASKTVLIELERARLAAKPSAPSIAPRVIELPAGPRPVPPAASVRIDASVTLAECTALGDLEALEKTTAMPPKAGPKFVVPSVPPVGAPRPNTPSTAPERPRTASGAQPVVRPKTPSLPPTMPTLAPLPRTPTGPVPKVVPADPVSVGPDSATMPAVAIGDLKPARIALDVALANAAVEMATAKTSPLDAVEGPATTTIAIPPDPDAGPTTTMDVPPAPLTPTEMAAVPPPPPTPGWLLTTTRSASPPPPPAQVVPAPPIIGTPRARSLEPDLDEPTDQTAMPIIPDDIRKTELAMVPKPSLELAPVEIIDAPQPLENNAPIEIDDVVTSVVSHPPAKPIVAEAPPRSTKGPTIEEPTPSGDWTITPGVDKPTIAQRVPGELTPVAQATDDAMVAKPGRLTGNWTIQLDPDTLDGWSEPSKVDAVKPDEPPKPKTRTKPTPETPPELRPVARSIMREPLPAAPAEKALPREEPKVQIDPTLMDAPLVEPDHGAPRPATLSALIPAQSMPMQVDLIGPQVERLRLATPVPGSMAPMMASIDHTPTPFPPGVDPRISNSALGRPTPVPGSLTAPPFPVSPSELVAMPTPPPGRLVTDGGVGFFRESGNFANLSGSGAFPVGDSTSLVEARRRRRLLVILISAGVAVAAGIVLLIMFAGGSKKASDEPVAPPPDAATSTIDATKAEVVVLPPDAVVNPAPPRDASIVVEPTPICAVDVTTVPAGAEVLIQGSKNVLGTTPARLELPCNVEAKLLVRKQRFANVVRPVTPTNEITEITKVRVILQRLMFSVKVSSSPAGAAISINGKQVAVTPTTMRLPAFELSTVTFSKEGYAMESSKVTPKQNNQTVHAQLKKKPKR